MMLQALLYLEDNQIEEVLAAVSQWCKQTNTDIQNEDGRRVLIAAINIIYDRPSCNVLSELRKHFQFNDPFPTP